MNKLLEMKERVRNLFVNNEVLKTDYLDTLKTYDRQNVESFIAAFSSPKTDFRGEQVALLAYGSSVRPPEKRDHSVEDIDIRILSSAPADSDLQKTLIQTAIEITQRFVEQQGWKSSFDPNCTTSQRGVYLDYDNRDPSFKLKPSNGGLPLHISISGPGVDTLDSHIYQERCQRQHFSILATVPQ